jgi:hypothetical protein
MSDPKDPANDREHFLGLVFLLRQLAAQLLEQKQFVEPRGLIDAVAALERKTKGNLDAEEEKLLADVLYELRMTAIASDRVDAPVGSGEGKSE